jgi:DNA-binding response OmpR family regulator
MTAALLTRRTRRQTYPRYQPLEEDSRPRVLIADDCEEFADYLAFMLRRQGYNARVVYDGPTAVRVAADFRPEAVLLDIGLPGFDGFEVARQVRRQTRSGEVYLVALTAYEDDFIRIRAQQAGFDEYLVKPVEVTVIESVLKAGLSRGQTTTRRGHPSAADESDWQTVPLGSDGFSDPSPLG